jgi:hypothetical protein
LKSHLGICDLDAILQTRPTPTPIQTLPQSNPTPIRDLPHTLPGTPPGRPTRGTPPRGPSQGTPPGGYPPAPRPCPPIPAPEPRGGEILRGSASSGDPICLTTRSRFGYPSPDLAPRVAQNKILKSPLACPPAVGHTIPRPTPNTDPSLAQPLPLIGCVTRAMDLLNCTLGRSTLFEI